MASLIYNDAKRALLAGELDLAADDVRMRLCMSDTTCGDSPDVIVNLADFGDIDVCDSVGYADEELDNQAVTVDDPNDRGEFDADDPTWTALASCTRTVTGALVYKYVDGTDANDVAIAWVEFASAKTPDGSDFTIQINVEGLLQLT